MLARILELIAGKGITEKQFLKDVGLNITTLSDWKAGKSQSYKKHADIIADYFNVSVDYLLGKTDIRNTAEHDEVDEYLDILHKRGDMRMLFSVAKNATKEDIEIAADIIEKLIKKERGEL